MHVYGPTAGADNPLGSNFFIKRNPMPNQCQISYGASLGRGKKVYINGPGHITKMAAMPIYGNQRTNGPVNAHLISWPSKAQNIQNLENIIMVKK